MDIDSYVMNTPDHHTFHLINTKVIPRSGVTAETANSPPVHGELGVETSEAAVTVLLGPHGTSNIDIEFLPRTQKTVTSLLILRNNLTIMDGVIVQGQGVLSMFTLDGRDPGNDHMPLHFNLTASYLAKCNESSHSFTMKKTFVAKNTGQLPIQVVSLQISGRPCAGYGFTIQNCQPFTIKPNTTHHLEIDFTPDFTLSRISRQLDIVTAEGLHLEFHLLATLPHNLLPVYLALFPRPSWEPYFNGCLCVLMVLMLVVVVALAYNSAKAYALPCSQENDAELYTRLRKLGAPLAGQVFDLNKIAGVGKMMEVVSQEEKKETMDADALQVEQAKVEEEQPVAVMEVERAPVDLKEIPPTNPKPAEKQMGVVPNTGDKLDSRTHAETEMGRQKVNTEKLTLPPTNVPKTGVDLPAENESEKQSKSK
jgi:hypothetical protein